MRAHSLITWIVLSFIISIILTIGINLAIGQVSICGAGNTGTQCSTLSSLFFFVPLFFVLTILSLAIFLFILWIIMIIDCIKRNFKTEEERILWILILLLTHILGALIYYFVVVMPSKKRSKKRTHKNKTLK